MSDNIPICNYYGYWSAHYVTTRSRRDTIVLGKQRRDRNYIDDLDEFRSRRIRRTWPVGRPRARHARCRAPGRLGLRAQGPEMARGRAGRGERGGRGTQGGMYLLLNSRVFVS